MSKIKSVVSKSNCVSVVLESGISSSIVCSSDLSGLVGIEIFDQRMIDDYLKKLNLDRKVTLSLSRFFLGLGALEMGKSVSDYVGFEINYSDDYFTVTDIIDD